MNWLLKRGRKSVVVVLAGGSLLVKEPVVVLGCGDKNPVLELELRLGLKGDKCPSIAVCPS
jgi:hypothetical protein